jgi:hypothetical protein
MFQKILAIVWKLLEGVPGYWKPSKKCVTGFQRALARETILPRNTFEELKFSLNIQEEADSVKNHQTFFFL